jgi:hypothetical protein
MPDPGSAPALEGARADVSAIASEFARAARPIVEAALRRRLDALVGARSGWFQGLKPDVAASFEAAADRAIARGAAEVERRLSDLDRWFDPRIAPGVEPRPEAGWDGALPEWVSAMLRRLSGRERAPGLGDLGDPGHRIWVALLSAATPLDAVLEEFGLAPSSIPDLGGGHFGLQPKTAADLDPSGTLERLWKRYLAVYERYASLAGR